MTTRYSEMAALKQSDMQLQAGAFALTLLLLFSGIFGLFPLYLMALVQCGSCVYWLFVSRQTPQLPAARGMRKLIVALMLAHLSFPVQELFALLLVLLLIGGPLAGTVYFVLTIKEYRYYTRLAADAAGTIPPSHE